MNIQTPSKTYILAALLLGVLPLVSGIAFYHLVVGDSGSHILSVLFGWQWLYLAIASIAALLVGLLRRNKKYVMASLIVVVALLGVLVPARIIEANRLYITGDGGPAGPHFACLVWEESALSNGSYGNDLGLCTLMSIPSYNKFAVDRSRTADSQDASPSYYIMLAANELAIVSGVYVAHTKLRPRPKDERMSYA